MTLNIIYGWHVVNHVLLNNYKLIVRLFILKKYKNFFYLLKILDKYNIKYFFVDVSFFNKCLLYKNHQGIYAEINNMFYKSEIFLFNILDKKKKSLILIFDSVIDPQNLGVCFRVSSLVGVDAVILPFNKSCLITDVVHKISCGMSLTIPVIRIINIVRFLSVIKSKNIYVIGTSEKAQLSLYNENLNISLAVVIGSEGSGLRYLTMKNCDSVISIPISGYVKSLNMSIATSVILFEVMRQRIYNI